MEIRAYHLGKEHEIWHLFHQTVPIRGQLLTNFKMAKLLSI